MQINRVYTAAGRSPFDGVSLETRPFGKATVEVPTFWSSNATKNLAGKYFRRAGVPSATVKIPEDGIPEQLQRSRPADNATYGGEQSLVQVVHRLAGYWAYWGLRFGYLDVENALALYDEMAYLLIHQLGAPNSPQWFNTGLSWAYGITGEASGYHYADFATGEVRPSEDLYTHSAVFACHILSVEDSLVGKGGIFDWIRNEAAIFKLGAGAGINVSSLRGEGELLSGGGTSSGMMSFLGVSDKAAGAIKSGGTTRRAAKMICVDLEHPDIEAFIDWKPREEEKVAMLVSGSIAVAKHMSTIMQAATSASVPVDARYDTHTNPQLQEAVRNAFAAAIPPALIERAVDLARQGFTSIETDTYTTDWDSEAYATVGGQNANLSVRVPNHFFDALDTDATWKLIRRTDRGVAREIRARDLWDKIAYNAWCCADPGVQMDTTFNEWHTVPNEGRINGTNPCSEYASIDNSSCNLASIRFTGYLNDDGSFDVARFEHSVELWTLVLEISVASGQLPAELLAANTWKVRNLGLGYADLGATIMRLALPYDSDDGRNLAAALTALMTGKAYETSARIAAEVGPFEAFGRNREHMLRVVRNHARAAGCAELGDYEGLSVLPVTYAPSLSTQTIWEAARTAWRNALRIGEVSGYRNSQVSVIAPAGTIGFIMDCDTTGIEPDFALVKTKQLAGGGYFRIVNNSVPLALRTLGYSREQIDDIVRYVKGSETFAGAPHINTETLRAKGLSDSVIARAEAALGGAMTLDYAFGLGVITPDVAKAVGYEDEGGSFLSHLGFTQTQISEAQDHILGRGSMEGAPHIKADHLPIFDCATPIGRSNRFIRPLAHVDMLAAVQPFVSGSISKTVNLPASATIEDVKSIYRYAWEKMVKAVALYRDRSKLSQPLMAGSLAVSGDASPTVPAAAVHIAERVVYRYIAQQRKLPDKRTGVTQKLLINGQKFFIRTGDYPDGSLGEIFIDSAKEGATLRALLNALAQMVSVALQYGVPLEEIVEQFTFSRFEPSGVVVGDDNVKMCTSILDAIFRILAVNYLGRLDLAHVKPQDVKVPSTAAPEVAIVAETDGDGRFGAVRRNGHSNAVTDALPSTALASNGHASAIAVREPQTRLGLQDAQRQGFTGNPCQTCHSMRVVLRGTCEYCEDCGNSNGACS